MSDDNENKIIKISPNELNNIETQKNLSFKNSLKQEIEELPQQYHIDFFDILNHNKEVWTENRYGIFINLNHVSIETCKEMDIKLKFIKKQIQELKNFEKTKKTLQKNYFDEN